MKRLALAALCAAGCASPPPDLDALFAPHDTGWGGADAVYSIPFGDRTLWLFGDTWVDRGTDHPRMIRNSVAVQRGDVVEFHCESECFVPDDPAHWYWPLHGVAHDGLLVIFLMELERRGDGSIFDFKFVRIVRARVDAATWDFEVAPMPWPESRWYGSAVLRDGDRFVVYGLDAHRRAVAAITRDFETYEEHPEPLFEGAATEYTVSRRGDGFIVVYTEIGFSPRILARTAPTPLGPWGEPRVLHEVAVRENEFAYAGKHHPQLARGDELVISYAVNSTDFAAMARDFEIYRPRFVRVR